MTMIWYQCVIILIFCFFLICIARFELTKVTKMYQPVPVSSIPCYVPAIYNLRFAAVTLLFTVLSEKRYTP